MPEGTLSETPEENAGGTLRRIPGDILQHFQKKFREKASKTLQKVLLQDNCASFL